jgi:hypothetical protein
MTKFQKSIATAIATGSMLLNSTIAFAQSTTLIITGNGTNTENKVDVQRDTTTYVSQTNTTNVQNDVKVNSTTGSNQAKDNTGGGVTVETGDSTVKVNVTNQVNSNVADVPACGSCQGDVTANVSGNGSDSENEIELKLNEGKDSTTMVEQTNVANVDNKVRVNSDTGRNEVEDTTGGDNSIETGDSTVKMNATTTANSNWAVIEGGSNGGDLTATIMGNGSKSENEIELSKNSSNWIDQANMTSIKNDMEANSKTGKNEIEDTTGGLVEIESGDSDITATVDNMAGFNAADLSCCSMGDVLAKVAENGVDTENKLEAELENTQGVMQDNSCGGYMPRTYGNNMGGRPCFDNHLALDGYTGDNKADDTTGDPGDDPSISTGDSEATVEVTNEGGSNVFGTMPEWHFPTSGTGIDFSFNFDLSDLLSWLNAQQA